MPVPAYGLSFERYYNMQAISSWIKQQRLSHCVCFILCILMLTGCTATGQLKGRSNAAFTKRSHSTLGQMSTYAIVKKDFEHGRIMKARSRVLAMEKSNKDYVKSLQLLRKKIEPARRRLFNHYFDKARAAEKNKLWYQAMSAYKQVREITIKPAVMEKKRLEMEHNLRQLRFDVLLSARRKEDNMLLINPHIYNAPKGANPEDAVFFRKRKQYKDDLDDRATRAYREAKRYLRKNMPEIAYIDIESYLRLQPDSDRGKELLIEIRKAMPRQLTIAPVAAISTIHPVKKSGEKAAAKKKGAKKTVARKPSSVKKVKGFVSAEQIQGFIQRGDLLRAKKHALIYRREGGWNAAQLLAQVQQAIKKKAARLFAEGGAAFRQEHLKQAILHWREAVTLMPEEAEYIEALRRAHQLDERLRLLRKAHERDPLEIEE